MKSSHALSLLVGLGSFITAISVGCGSDANRIIVDEDADIGEGGSGPLFNSDGGDAKKACVGLQCQQKECGGGKDTTVTGKVFAPNGKLALYNAIVYVPNAKPEPLTQGATCDKCGAVTGEPIVTALTDSTGTFELKNVPVGKDIPLVIQIGKWRRQVVIPEVKECTENALTDPELTRLPKNQTEGDMPRIALTTGGCDKLGCMLPKVGIDASEFGNASDGPSKSVHIYRGAGGSGPAASGDAAALWSNAEAMKQYDMLILSCECDEHLENKGGANGAAFAAMTAYLEAGGRIFTTDFMYSWYRYTPNANLKSAVNLRGGAPVGGSPMEIDTSFPKGQALSDWLDAAANIKGGKVTPDVVWGNIISLDAAKSQQWATSGPGTNPAVVPAGPRLFSVNLPVGVPADQQCGKGVHIDAHVNQTGSDAVSTTYPTSCNSPLKPAENLLTFFFFDLASCIQNEAEPPKPPPVK